MHMEAEQHLKNTDLVVVAQNILMRFSRSSLVEGCTVFQDVDMETKHIDREFSEE